MNLEKEKLEALVQELMKDQPDQKLVKKLVKDLKIPQSSDLLLQTSQVLEALNGKKDLSYDL